jgi:hypothetical protein
VDAVLCSCATKVNSSAEEKPGILTRLDREGHFPESNRFPKLNGRRATKIQTETRTRIPVLDFPDRWVNTAKGPRPPIRETVHGR